MHKQTTGVAKKVVIAILSVMLAQVNNAAAQSSLSDEEAKTIETLLSNKIWDHKKYNSIKESIIKLNNQLDFVRTYGNGRGFSKLSEAAIEDATQKFADSTSTQNGEINSHNQANNPLWVSSIYQRIYDAKLNALEAAEDFEENPDNRKLEEKKIESEEQFAKAIKGSMEDKLKAIYFLKNVEFRKELKNLLPGDPSTKKLKELGAEKDGAWENMKLYVIANQTVKEIRGLVGQADDFNVFIGEYRQDITKNHDEITTNMKNIKTNETNILKNTKQINTNEKNIADNNKNIANNTKNIARLSDDIDVIRSGVAASLAVAAMPVLSREGWGAAVGTGYFDGESAIAAGLTYSSNAYHLKFAVGHSGGHNAASAGATWAF